MRLVLTAVNYHSKLGTVLCFIMEIGVV